MNCHSPENKNQNLYHGQQSNVFVPIYLPPQLYLINSTTPACLQFFKWPSPSSVKDFALLEHFVAQLITIGQFRKAFPNWMVLIPITHIWPQVWSYFLALCSQRTTIITSLEATLVYHFTLIWIITQLKCLPSEEESANYCLWVFDFVWPIP
jgi:hypothetical protein